MSNGPRWGSRSLAVYSYLAIAFLLLPELVAIGVSFNPTTRMVLPSGSLSFRWYKTLWSNASFAHAFELSLVVAPLASAAAILLGGTAAYALSRYRLRHAHIVGALFFAPLVVPGAAVGAAMFLWLNLIYLTETVTGIVIAHVVLTLPYTFRTLTAAFGGLDRAYEEAAMSLGASRAATLRRVVLPLIRPGLLAAALFSLIVSLDEFTVTLFVSGRTIATFPLQIFNAIEYGLDPTVTAAATVMLGLSAIAIVLLERAVGLRIADPTAQ